MVAIVVVVDVVVVVEVVVVVVVVELVVDVVVVVVILVVEDVAVLAVLTLPTAQRSRESGIKSCDIVVVVDVVVVNNRSISEHNGISQYYGWINIVQVIVLPCRSASNSRAVVGKHNTKVHEGRDQDSCRNLMQEFEMDFVEKVSPKVRSFCF